MKIRVDSNEAWENSQIVDGLKKLGHEIVVEHLEVGDYICGRTLIEHKRLANWAGDVESGHVFQQAQDMRYSMLLDPNLKCYILVSGDIENIFKLTKLEIKDGVKKMVPIKVQPEGQIAAWASLTSEHYGIPVCCLSNNWFMIHGMHYLFLKDNDGKVSKVNPVRLPIKFSDQVLTNYASIDGVGEVTAKKLQKIFPIPKNLYNATELQLKQIEGFGEKTIRKLLNFFNGIEEKNLNTDKTVYNMRTEW